MIEPAISVQIVLFGILMWSTPLLFLWPAMILKRAFDET